MAREILFRMALFLTVVGTLVCGGITTLYYVHWKSVEKTQSELAVKMAQLQLAASKGERVDPKGQQDIKYLHKGWDEPRRNLEDLFFVWMLLTIGFLLLPLGIYYSGTWILTGRLRTQRTST